MSTEDEMTHEEKRKSMIDDIVAAPTDAVERIYD